MEDGHGEVLRDEERVRERWKEYFENLVNEEYPREQHQNGTPMQAHIQESVKGGGHFSKFSTRVAKMSISISSAYSHGEVYIRMVLAYSVFL